MDSTDSTKTIYTEFLFLQHPLDYSYIFFILRTRIVTLSTNEEFIILNAALFTDLFPPHFYDKCNPRLLLQNNITS